MAKTVKFSPTHRLHTALEEGRSVTVFADEERRFGLMFINSDLDVTRCMLTKEAAQALTRSLTDIQAGLGDPYRTPKPISLETEWRVVPNTLVVEPSDA